MGTPDPFEVLGLVEGCTPEEVRDAWRRAMLVAHPDHGGSAEMVSRVNQARDALLTRSPRSRESQVSTSGWARDVPSFSIGALPVDAFSSLRIVADQIGRIVDEEEPYLLEFTLEHSESFPDLHAWCRCEIVPEAGASLVHLALSTTRPVEFASIETLRDEIVGAINRLDDAH